MIKNGQINIKQNLLASAAWECCHLPICSMSMHHMLLLEQGKAQTPLTNSGKIVVMKYTQGAVRHPVNHSPFFIWSDILPLCFFNNSGLNVKFSEWKAYFTHIYHLKFSFLLEKLLTKKHIWCLLWCAVMNPWQQLTPGGLIKWRISARSVGVRSMRLSWMVIRFLELCYSRG